MKIKQKLLNMMVANFFKTNSSSQEQSEHKILRFIKHFSLAHFTRNNFVVNKVGSCTLHPHHFRSFTKLFL